MRQLLLLCSLIFTGFSTLAQVSHPGQFSPADNVSYGSMQVFYNMRDKEDFDSFLFEMDTLSSFSSPFFMRWRNEEGFGRTDTLEIGQTYYFRSKVYKGGDSSAFNSYITFSISKDLRLFSPVDLSNGPVPELRWINFSSRQYRVQISADDQFNNQILLDTLVKDYRFSDAKIYRFGETYHWRVKALQGSQESNWSEERQFTTLNQAQIQAPRTGVFTRSQSARLYAFWEDIDLAKVHVQAATSISFDTLTLNDTFEDNNNHSWDSTKWDFNTLNYIRLRYLLPNDSTAWSGTGILSLESPIALSSGAIEPDSNVLLRWSFRDNGESYEVQLDTSLDFDSPSRVDSFTQGQSFIRTGKLRIKSRYYWRVRAMHIYDTSEWSAVKTFLTPSAQYAYLNISGVNKFSIGETPSAVEARLTGSGVFSQKYFEFQIDTSLSFGSPVMQKIDGENIVVNFEDLLFGERYYARARFSDGQDTSEWIDVVTFDVLEEIENSYPPNGAINWGLSQNLSIKDQPNGVKYYIYQFDTTEAFNSPLLYESSDADGESMPVPSPFYFSTWYYWRAAMVNGADTSAWGDTWSFESYSIQFLFSPKNGAEDQATTLELDWGGDSDAEGYELQYGLDTPFTMQPMRIDSGFITDTTLRFQDGETYYWRVRPFHAFDVGPWSEVWTFSTSDAPVIPTPRLVAPNNNAQDLSPVQITFRWQGTNNNQDRYRLQISYQPNFQSLLYNETSPLKQQVITGFNANTTYYWRVRNTRNGQYQSEWSNVFSFSTEADDNSLLTLDAPSLRVYPNPFSDRLNLPEEAQNVKIYSAQGQLIYEKAEETQVPNINTENWPAGIYILEIGLDGKQWQQRLVKN